jgi:hypothetical protein
VDPEQGARVLGLLGEAAHRAGEARHLSTCLSPFFGAEVATHFATLDADLPQRRQRLLFDRGDSALEALGPYGHGYRIASDAGPRAAAMEDEWAYEATLCATVPAGALHPLPARPRDGVPAARAWLEFARRRAEPELARKGLTPRAEPAAPALFPESPLTPSTTDA